jgi:hypothetical protein
MIEERKMNILLYRKVFPCAPAPKKEAPYIPTAKAGGFTARVDKRAAYGQ